MVSVRATSVVWSTIKGPALCAEGGPPALSQSHWAFVVQMLLHHGTQNGFLALHTPISAATVMVNEAAAVMAIIGASLNVSITVSPSCTENNTVEITGHYRLN